MLQTKEVVKAMAGAVEGGSQVEAKKYLDAFKEVVVTALENGEDVKLKGFVDFTSKEVSARTKRNPKTGEAVQVEAHRKATASLSKTLRKF